MADFPHGLNLYDRVKEINREGYHISLKIWDTVLLFYYKRHNFKNIELLLPIF